MYLAIVCSPSCHPSDMLSVLIVMRCGRSNEIHCWIPPLQHSRALECFPGGTFHACIGRVPLGSGVNTMIPRARHREIAVALKFALWWPEVDSQDSQTCFRVLLAITNYILRRRFHSNGLLLHDFPSYKLEFLISKFTPVSYLFPV